MRNNFTDSDTFEHFESNSASNCIPQLNRAVPLSDYPALTELKHYLTRGNSELNGGVPRMIEPERIMILESELENQRLLPRTSERQATIAYCALRDVAALRWRARRMGERPEEYRFRIDLPRYLLFLAESLIAAGEPATADYLAFPIGVTAPECPALASRKVLLDRLDSLADFLLSSGRSTRDCYQLAMQKLLIFLLRRPISMENEAKRCITLPLSTREFSNMLKIDRTKRH